MNQQPFILCVDDDASSQMVMEVHLKEIMGFTNVIIFENSANFMDRLNALPTVPDLIFLDMHVKPYDGGQMFQMIQNNERFKNTIVIALTASVMSNEIAQLRQIGFKSLIGKPINPLTFPNNLQQIISGKDIWDPSWA